MRACVRACLGEALEEIFTKGTILHPLISPAIQATTVLHLLAQYLLPFLFAVSPCAGSMFFHLRILIYWRSERSLLLFLAVVIFPNSFDEKRNKRVPERAERNTIMQKKNYTVTYSKGGNTLNVDFNRCSI